MDVHDNDSSKRSLRQRMHASIMMLAALMISFGQWNDTRALVVRVYESILANFTNTVEYDLLSSVHVGNSLTYIETILGTAHVIERSRLNEAVHFHYYSEQKFDLTLISKDNRIVGYAVSVKENGFSPIIPFAENLGSSTLADVATNQPTYNFDTSNLIYFLAAEELGKQQMYLTLVRGYVEYGGFAVPELHHNSYRQNVTQAIKKLDHITTHTAENHKQSEKAVTEIQELVLPNYFAVAEINSELVAESLLTRYEYRMLTQS